MRAADAGAIRTTASLSTTPYVERRQHAYKMSYLPPVAGVTPLGYPQPRNVVVP